MATQNLFEKYGIKEVADVTFYRIEKKEETYESQRKITASSILRGALELRDVYPMTNGVGDEEGFQAYVFTEGIVNRGTNYDCDDESTFSATIQFRYSETNSSDNVEDLMSGLRDAIDAIKQDFVDAAVAGTTIIGHSEFTDIEFANIRNITIEKNVKATDLASYEDIENIEITGEPIRIPSESRTEGTNINELFRIPVTFTAVVDADELETGVFDNTDAYKADETKEVGTHEYSYAEQICMLFAKRQNLIAKTGVRYLFENADTIFGDITFNTDFAAAPFSTQKVIVVGLDGKFDEGSYDFDEINEVISGLRDSIEAKAYDVTYNDYAELVVEDEMGYYNPAFLGEVFNRKAQAMTPFTENRKYQDVYPDEKTDEAIAEAVMWGDNLHYSINDAIDALRQKQLILDASEESGVAGINNIFGGYKVSSYEDGVVDPEPGSEDTETNDKKNEYAYKTEDALALQPAKDKNGEEVKSNYTLTNVKAAVNSIGRANTAFGKDLRVDIVDGARPSNRAIYIRVDGAVDTAAGAYIYLLHNVNYKKLSLDKVGIFKFFDKKGNKLYYQDKIFKGVEYLALVILGDKGLIYVVNRHGGKNTGKIAWMVNDKGYVNNSQAKTLVNNGLIHTTDITVNNETFEATCTVGELKVHITKKTTDRYVPVLFLDTLKVSTIEQTAENVFATGGRGNANLIGWDYGKEITLTLEDALFTPASMSAIFGASDGSDFRKGVKEAKVIDRMEPVTAKRSFIVPAGNQNGVPSEADKTAQAVFVDPRTMEPYQDGTPIAEGERFLKWTRSVAYEGQSIGSVIEISADKFPGTYKIVGDTYVRSKETGEDQRFQFIVPQAKMTSEQTITLEADGDPAVFDMNMTVLRPEDGVMIKFVQYDVVENEEENDGSTMVKGTENLNLLDDAELFRVNADGKDDEIFIGATEY